MYLLVDGLFVDYLGNVAANCLTFGLGCGILGSSDAMTVAVYGEECVGIINGFIWIRRKCVMLIAHWVGD